MKQAEPLGGLPPPRRSLPARIRTLQWASVSERVARLGDRVRARTRHRRDNLRWLGSGPRFLVVRQEPEDYDVLLRWVEEHVPELRKLFEVRLLPCRVADWAAYALHVPWLRDPVESWSRRTYRRACRLAEACDRHHVPVINRVDRLSNATKVEGARRISAVGLRTAAMRRIDDPEEFRATRGGLSLPIFVREDAGHGGPMLRADTDDELRALPIEALQRPVAVELVDVRGPDGLYRKFRYVVAGRVGLPHHMQATDQWITRGNIRFYSPTTRAQEEAYVARPDPLHEAFQRARAALGLDLVAFDYSLDRGGQPIVWEANPYPYLHIPRSQRLAYLAPAMHRTLAAVVHLYLERAGLARPARLEELLFASPAVTYSPPDQSAAGAVLAAR